MDFNRKTNPINLKDYTTSEQFPASNPPSYKHRQTSLFEYAEDQGSDFKQQRRQVKGGGLYDDVGEDPWQGLKGSCHQSHDPWATNSKPRSDIRPTLCPREDTAVLL